MRLLCLSAAAAALLHARYEADSRRPVRTVGLDDLAAALDETGDPALVVAEVAGIDNRLAAVVHAASRAGGPVGIVPFDAARPTSLFRLIDEDAGRLSADAKVGVYSSRGLNRDFMRSAPAESGPVIVELHRRTEGAYTSPDDACYQVRRHDFTALGIVTEGRQTYCLLGMGCIHPTISSPQIGRLTPEHIAADHWLLQSCHSPYAWRDLGTYVTIPLAIALSGRARTVICSTHVQTYIPDLLPVYVELLTAGRTAGEIVSALNEHASRAGVDSDPFVLFGNPQSRPIATPTATPRAARGDWARARAQASRNVDLVRRLITNVEFIRRDNPFGLDAQNNHRFAAFQRDTAWMSRLDLRAVHERATPYDGLEALLDGLRPENVRTTTAEITRRLGPAWRAEGGFYKIGEKLDESYVADGAVRDGSVCAVCAEPVLDRSMRYVGLGSSAAYTRRRQRVCPRCLVVEHVSPEERDATVVDVQRRDRGLAVELTYTNRTADPKWLYAFAFVSDPNNVSRHTGRTIYQKLLAKLPQQQCGHGPLALEPNAGFTFQLEIGPVPDEFWYVLVEVNLFVDFCWNWFSFTYRSPRLEDWLASRAYQKSLPRAWRNPGSG